MPASDTKARAETRSAPKPATASAPTLPVCDVVVDGDLPAGLVVPEAASTLARTRMLRTIGGVSAGVVPAVLLAAAEHARASGGVERLPEIARDLEKHAPRLLQPSADARPLYAMAKEGLGEGRIGRALWTLLFHHGQYVLVGAMIAFVLGLFSAAIGGSLFGVVFTVLVFAAVAIGLSAWSVAAQASDVLRANDWGLVPGTTQEDAEGVGLSDWLADAIEDAAGRGLPEDSTTPRAPLTFGDLVRGARPVTLILAATDLAGRRPVRLPCTGEDLWFDEAELRRVVPGWVVDWMVARVGDATGPRPRLRPLPGADDLPVVVAARIALGFPGLIAATPLWRASAKGAERLLFVDGTLSGSLPTDAVGGLLPDRPVVRITTRPERAPQPIDGTRAMFVAAFESARAAQDRLGPALPSPDALASDDAELWRRFEAAYAALEATLGEAASRWSNEGEGESLRAALGRIAAEGDGGASPEVRAAMVARMDALMTHVAGWDRRLAAGPGGPAPGARLRLVSAR